jgi:7-cyano-7-deazaguanine synthase
MMMDTTSNKAYILLSGGQDSFTCLLWSLKHFREVEAVTISYGQRHEKELTYAAKIAEEFQISHFIYNIGNFFRSIATSTLLNEGDHNSYHPVAKSLPASFVPNRNGIFLTIAANHAFNSGEKHIHLVTGTCQTDYSGYPDCRDNYIRIKAVELSLGLDIPVNIHTPLMWLTKAETFKMADDEGKLKALNELTLSCYNGVEILNEWGRGCGECPACKLRKRGYYEFLELQNRISLNKI